MKSPARNLMNKVLGDSVFRIAPERAAETGSALGTFDLILSNERRWQFQANPKTREVFVSRGAVELIWCASLAHFLFYTRLVQGKQVAEVREINPRADPEVRTALDLLRWAINCQLNHNLADDWPSGLPSPEEVPADDIGNAANEICLVTCAFILHHELAHIRLAHTGKVDAPTSVDREKDADNAAADWVLGGVDPDSDVFVKRVLGASGAFVLTTAMGLYGWSLGGDTHPFAYDRLSHLLSRYSSERDQVAEYVAFVILDLHFENSGHQLKRRSFSDARDALDSICDELAEIARVRSHGC